MQARNICIIPARGGSKRIPRKNIKEFLGKPIIAYSVECAISSLLFEEVMVSTDDQEIAGISLSLGASVPFLRSTKNADDYTTTVAVVKEVLDNYRSLDRIFDNVCVLYPTAPLSTAVRLIEGYEKLTYADAVIPITQFSYPIWRGFRIDDNKISYQWPEFKSIRSQDLSPVYHDAGQWYWIRTKKITDTLIVENSAPLLLSNLEVQDIDNQDDWEIAEMKYLLMQMVSQKNKL